MAVMSDQGNNGAFFKILFVLLDVSARNGHIGWGVQSYQQLKGIAQFFWL